MNPVALLKEQERQALDAGQFERAALLRETAEALQSMEDMAQAREKALQLAWEAGYEIGKLEAMTKMEHAD